MNIFGCNQSVTLKLEIWVSHVDCNTKIHAFVQELILHQLYLQESE